MTSFAIQKRPLEILFRVIYNQHILQHNLNYHFLIKRLFDQKSVRPFVICYPLQHNTPHNTKIIFCHIYNLNKKSTNSDRIYRSDIDAEYESFLFLS